MIKGAGYCLVSSVFWFTVNNPLPSPTSSHRRPKASGSWGETRVTKEPSEPWWAGMRWTEVRNGWVSSHMSLSLFSQPFLTSHTPSLAPYGHSWWWRDDTERRGEDRNRMSDRRQGAVTNDVTVRRGVPGRLTDDPRQLMVYSPYSLNHFTWIISSPSGSVELVLRNLLIS